MSKPFRPHALAAIGLAAFAAVAALMPAAPAQAATAPAAPAAPSAASAPDAQRWDLRDLYPTPEAWDAAYAQARQRADALPALQERAGSSAAALRDTLLTISDLQRELARLWVYAHLSGDEDLRVARGQERKQQAMALWSSVDEKNAWIAPAVLQWGPEKVRGWIAADPVLKARFDFYLEDILRNAAHTLTPEGEGLLAAAGAVLSQPNTVFEQLVESELPRPTVALSKGKPVKLDISAYELYRQSRVRADRKRVFDAFFGSLKSVEGTLGANLNTQVQGAVFSARARKFGSALEDALWSTNMPPAVYRQLVEQAHAGLPVLHRYLKLRQKMLGIGGSLAYYDNYPPLAEPPKSMRFDIARSQAITLAALQPLGDEYLGLLKKGFAAQWIDSHPRPSKASGGYMAGAAYDVHPYLLLNHNDDYQSLSTYAHEWGHAVHTMLAKSAQPFDKAGYATFIAESASIGNEMLLSDYVIAHAKTPEEKLFYLTQALESIRTTFFRQTLFAEFQLAMHEEVEAGKPLTGPRLTQLYCGIAKRYYGEAEGVMTVDPAYCTEWGYVSHFYRGFYVWQYATSIVGAAQFTEAIEREGAPARDRFITLLKAGGSDYPYELYRKAGIDMAQPQPYQALIARMSRLVDALEALQASGTAGRSAAH